jgi:hypothetical protein
MYGLTTEMALRLRTNDGLREYARLEYGTPDAAWIIAAASRASPKSRRRIGLTRRIRGVFSSRARTGFPRLPEDCPARA